MCAASERSARLLVRIPPTISTPMKVAVRPRAQRRRFSLPATCTAWEWSCPMSGLLPGNWCEVEPHALFDVAHVDPAGCVRRAPLRAEDSKDLVHLRVRADDLDLDLGHHRF